MRQFFRSLFRPKPPQGPDHVIEVCSVIFKEYNSTREYLSQHIRPSEKRTAFLGYVHASVSAEQLRSNLQKWVKYVDLREMSPFSGAVNRFLFSDTKTEHFCLLLEAVKQPEIECDEVFSIVASAVENHIERASVLEGYLAYMAARSGSTSQFPRMMAVIRELAGRNTQAAARAAMVLSLLGCKQEAEQAFESILDRCKPSDSGHINSYRRRSQQQ